MRPGFGSDSPATFHPALHRNPHRHPEPSAACAVAGGAGRQDRAHNAWLDLPPLLHGLLQPTSTIDYGCVRMSLASHQHYTSASRAEEPCRKTADGCKSANTGAACRWRSAGGAICSDSPLCSQLHGHGGGASGGGLDSGTNLPTSLQPGLYRDPHGHPEPGVLGVAGGWTTPERWAWPRSQPSLPRVIHGLPPPFVLVGLPLNDGAWKERGTPPSHQGSSQGSSSLKRE